VYRLILVWSTAVRTRHRCNAEELRQRRPIGWTLELPSPAVVDAVVPITVTPEQSGVVAMLRAQQQVHATAVPNES
jgi:hypothetical protein